LFYLIQSSNYYTTLQVHHLTKYLELIMDLESEFSRRCQDESEKRAWINSKALKNGQRKGKSFSASRESVTNAITT
jgi:hypothetical protein